MQHTIIRMCRVRALSHLTAIQCSRTTLFFLHCLRAEIVALRCATNDNAKRDSLLIVSNVLFNWPWHPMFLGAVLMFTEYAHPPKMHRSKLVNAETGVGMMNEAVYTFPYLWFGRLWPEAARKDCIKLSAHVRDDDVRQIWDRCIARTRY